VQFASLANKQKTAPCAVEYLIMHITAKELLAYTCMTFDKIPSQTPQWIKVAVSQAQKTQS
jgi:hypothetical protein